MTQAQPPSPSFPSFPSFPDPAIPAQSRSRAAWLLARVGLLSAGLATAACTAWAADLPLWEAGIGVGALHVPHYRGSDQSHNWLLPVPYFVYRGTILKSDRDGTRAVLLDTRRLDIDLSLDASPPLRQGDNRARADMPGLAATLEVGPNVNWLLGKGRTEAYSWKLDLRLPLRGVFTVESRPQAIGWTSTPVLNLDLEVRGWNIGLQGGPLLGTRRFHGYFYDVAPAYATAGRAAFAAPGGYAGWGLTGSASHRVGDWWLAAFARTDSVAGAAFEGSPLVKQRQNTTFGLALSWVFKVSDTRVAAER
jgi:outer membrane scaffolding protein for murein synthesis (MipA/OmpV family)